jgi:hypothetical protein
VGEAVVECEGCVQLWTREPNWMSPYSPPSENPPPDTSLSPPTPTPTVPTPASPSPVPEDGPWLLDPGIGEESPDWSTPPSTPISEIVDQDELEESIVLNPLPEVESFDGPNPPPLPTPAPPSQWQEETSQEQQEGEGDYQMIYLQPLQPPKEATGNAGANGQQKTHAMMVTVVCVLSALAIVVLAIFVGRCMQHGCCGGCCCCCLRCRRRVVPTSENHGKTASESDGDRHLGTIRVQRPAEAEAAMRRHGASTVAASLPRGAWKPQETV